LVRSDQSDLALGFAMEGSENGVGVFDVVWDLLSEGQCSPEP
jgi:hypothetical protein